jgi:hypothetical protein
LLRVKDFIGLAEGIRQFVEADGGIVGDIVGLAIKAV